MKKERAFLLTLALIQFTHIVDFMIMMPLGPQLMRLFSISPAQFALLVSSYTLSAGVCGFLGAFFLDRFERRSALQVVYAGFLIGTLACSFAPGFGLLMAARILTGAFGGLLGSLILSLVGDNIPLERRSSAMGIVMTAFSLASIAGVPAGLWLGGLYGWNKPFLALAVLGVLVQLLIRSQIPLTRKHLDRPTRGRLLEPLFNLRADNNQQKALLLQFFLMMGHFSLIPFLSPYMVSNVGLTEAQLPLIYLFGGMASIFSLPLIGKLADQVGRLKVFTFGILLSAIPQLLITHMPAVSLVQALLVTTIFFITTGGRTIPANTMITAAAPPAQRGSFMSLNVAVQQMSSGIAAWIAGMIIQRPDSSGPVLYYNWVGYFAIFFSLLALLVAYRLKVARGS